MSEKPLDAQPTGMSCITCGARMLQAPGCKCGCEGKPFCPISVARRGHR